jgi:S-formylglutathione hydrolase FrmB
MRSPKSLSRRTFLMSGAAVGAVGVGLSMIGCAGTGYSADGDVRRDGDVPDGVAPDGGVADADADVPGDDGPVLDAAPPEVKFGGLTVTDSGVVAGRMHYYRFATSQISWQPAVNVLLPEDYATSSTRYPVLYLLHGGAQDFRKFHQDDDILGLTTGRKVIVVMPDGGIAGWYCNPVLSLAGPKNWENFHIHQLIPWIDTNFRTYAEYDGRAVSGFSMGGFGALKYAAKYYGHFASVSAHSGPPSLRRDAGAVLQWAQVSAKAAELGGGTLYGEPADEARVSADNPVERLDSFGYGKRIFMCCGTDLDVNETPVRLGQQEFSGLLTSRGIAHERYELPGGHFVRREMLQADIDGVIARLKKA